MNLWEEYQKRGGKKSPSKEASIVFGILNMMEINGLLGWNWEKKTSEEKSVFMKDVLFHFPIWEKNLSSVD